MKTADIIIKGGSIFCGINLPDDMDFVAVKGNRIIGTGKLDSMEGFKGPDTKVIEVPEDSFIMPGIHDNHIHLIQGGMLYKYVGLYEAESKEECGEIIRDFAETIPDEEWVIAIGFTPHDWKNPGYPDAKDLDRFIPDRPVLVFDDEAHCLWLNTKAMKMCGITADSPVPENGVITRNEDGYPAGIFIDAAAYMVKDAFQFDEETVISLINTYVDFAVEMGITSVSDMSPYLGMDMSFDKIHLKMIENGESRIRINCARSLLEDFDEYEKHRKEADERGQGMYSVSYMKEFLDGTPYNYTGWLLDDYTDKPGEKGKSYLDIEYMNDKIKGAAERGISVRLHSCGDASCRAGLDAYEKAMKAFPDSKSRFMIEHAEVVDPEDMTRFGQLGVIASVQPEHCATWPYDSNEDFYDEYLGDRYFNCWPYNTIHKSGAVLAGGSDCPVVPGNPYYGMFAGLTRYYADMKMPEGSNPDEKLSMDTVLDMYTRGAAFAESREDELGTLEEGKLADIIVVDRNLIELAATEDPALRNAKSILTMVDGRIVYRQEE